MSPAIRRQMKEDAFNQIDSMIKNAIDNDPIESLLKKSKFKMQNNKVDKSSDSTSDRSSNGGSKQTTMVKKRPRIIRINQKSSKVKLINKLNMLRSKAHSQASNAPISVANLSHNESMIKKEYDDSEPTPTKLSESKNSYSILARNKYKSKNELDLDRIEKSRMTPANK